MVCCSVFRVCRVLISRSQARKTSIIIVSLGLQAIVPSCGLRTLHSWMIRNSSHTATGHRTFRATTHCEDGSICSNRLAFAGVETRTLNLDTRRWRSTVQQGGRRMPRVRSHGTDGRANSAVGMTSSMRWQALRALSTATCSCCCAAKRSTEIKSSNVGAVSCY